VRDVAQLAGVSVGTVSHVLNHPDRVARGTRERVEAAIAELGFVRSETARRLRHGGSSLVGVLVHDISNPFFTEAARGIEDRLRQGGRVPMLGSTDSDPDRERELMSLLAGLDVRGVIVTPSDSTLDNLAVLAGRGIRVVLMDHPPLTAELPTVSADDVAGARRVIHTVRVALGAGFALQILAAALSYLTPVMLGGGPATTRVTNAIMDRAADYRVVAANSCLLPAVLPVLPWTVRLTCALTAGAVAGYVPIGMGLSWVEVRRRDRSRRSRSESKQAEGRPR